jgi:hypothetical protein
MFRRSIAITILCRSSPTTHAARHECVAMLNETIEGSLTQLLLGAWMRRSHAGRDLAGGSAG